MPVAFQISEEDIAFAESVLLPRGAQFDDERRRFIRNLKTIDLQAVPGSGKTTALLAKLIALDRHPPQSGRSAILVISHTNAAVNEIRHRIGPICPGLFAYPHFVGTIQSFVDKFLAIPSFVNALGFRPSRIDADAYNLEISRRYQNLHQGVKNWIDRNGRADPEGFVQSLRFDSELNLTAGLGGRIVLKCESQSATYKTLAGMKNALLNKGLLHFEDVFLFAESLLQSDAQAKRLLRKRFGLIFVDEMQDMAPHQHGILEGLFGHDAGPETIFQRIGDNDQAIFGGNNIVDTEGWHPRAETLTLTNSLRLSQPIASILSPFAYERDDDFEITGLNDSSILPHLLIYDDESIGSVTRRYAQLIEQFQLDGSLPPNTKGRFKAIAWNSVWSDIPDRDDRKLRLVDFCPSFRRAALRKQEEFETLADYISNIDPDDRTLCSARNGIVRGVCRALMLADVVDPRSERHFTPRTLASYLRYEVATEIYQRINRILLRLSVHVVARSTGVTHRYLRLFVPMLVEHFDRDCDSDNFCSFLTGTQTADGDASTENASDPNLLRFGNVEISLGTVHSVKGQTHMATLYFESSYFNDGGKKYESQRLAPQFKGMKLRANAGKRVRESAKMVYVGFSRPTHLLVFAVHKERYESYLSDIDTTRWELIKLFEERGDT